MFLSYILYVFVPLWITDLDHFPKLLKLTPHDDVIYSKLRTDFPDLRVELVSDFAPGNVPDIVSSLQIHPQGKASFGKRNYILRSK